MPLFVLRIADDGAARLDGRLLVGDQIIEINGVTTHLMTHAQVRSQQFGIIARRYKLYFQGFIDHFIILGNRHYQARRPNGSTSDQEKRTHSERKRFLHFHASHSVDQQPRQRISRKSILGCQLLAAAATAAESRRHSGLESSITFHLRRCRRKSSDERTRVCRQCFARIQQSQ